MANLSPFDRASGRSSEDEHTRASDRGRDGRRDRGQLVLVGAFSLAVALVALVLVTNAAIYTENLATRDPDVGESDVLGYRAAVQDGVGGILERENAALYDDRTALEANVTNGTVTLGELLARGAALDGASARVNESSIAYTDGRLVRQNGSTDAPSTFLNESDAADWTVGTDLDRTRAFEATVTRDSLEDAVLADLLGAFHVVVRNASGVEWHVYVYDNSGDITVAVKNGSEAVADATEVCSVNAANATVRLTEGTLAGEPCPGLAFGRGVDGRYDLLVRNGDSAAGNYSLTLRTADAGAVSASDVSGTVGPDDPYSVPAVYAVRVRVTYLTDEVVFGERLRVAPGEPDA